MTDPAPGAGHDDSHHDEPQDIAAAASASSAPTASSPPQAAEDQTSPGHVERSRGGAEPSEATEEDGEDGESDEGDEEESEESEDDEDEDEDDEPRLKYARLTQHLGGVYKNADATSSFLVAGDKMVIGTHNGNIVGP